MIAQVLKSAFPEYISVARCAEIKSALFQTRQDVCRLCSSDDSTLLRSTIYKQIFFHIFIFIRFFFFFLVDAIENQN